MKWKRRFSEFWRTYSWEVEDRVRINSRHAIFLSGEYTLAELEEIIHFVRSLPPVAGEQTGDVEGETRPAPEHNG